MIDTLVEMFSYRFMVRAGVVGLLVSLCAALLGVCLVLKRYSMIGDGLSHVGFGALAVASALGLAPMAVAVPVVVVAAFLLLRLSSRGKLKGDAMIAMISTAALAVGVIVYGYVNDRRAKQMQAELMEEVSQSAAAGEAAAESVAE